MQQEKKKRSVFVLQWTEDVSPSLVTKFSVEKASSLLGCSDVFMTYASFGNPDLQRKASIWFGNQSTNYLALERVMDALRKGTTWGCLCHGKFGLNAGASVNYPKGT